MFSSIFLLRLKRFITSSIFLRYSALGVDSFTLKSVTVAYLRSSLKKLLGSLMMLLGVRARCSILIEGPSLENYSISLLLLAILLILELVRLSDSLRGYRICGGSSRMGISPQISPRMIAWFCPTDIPRIVEVGRGISHGVTSFFYLSEKRWQNSFPAEVKQYREWPPISISVTGSGTPTTRMMPISFEKPHTKTSPSWVRAAANLPALTTATSFKAAMWMGSKMHFLFNEWSIWPQELSPTP